MLAIKIGRVSSVSLKYFSNFFMYPLLLFFSTAKLSDVKTHVLALLNRHSMVFGNYRWTEFDEDFLQRNVETVALVDLEEMITQVYFSIQLLLVGF